MKQFKILSILLGIILMSSVGYASHVTKPDKPDKVCIQKAFAPYDVTFQMDIVAFQDVQTTSVGIPEQSYQFTNPYQGIEISTVHLINPEPDTGNIKHILIRNIGKVQKPYIAYSMASRCRNNC